MSTFKGTQTDWGTGGTVGGQENIWLYWASLCLVKTHGLHTI